MIIRAAATLLLLFSALSVFARGNDSFFSADRVRIANGIAWFGALCRSDGTPQGTRCANNLGDAPILLNGKTYILDDTPSPGGVYVVNDDLRVTKLVEIDPRTRVHNLSTDGTNLYCFVEERIYRGGVRLVKIDTDTGAMSTVKWLQTNEVKDATRVGTSLVFHIRDQSRWSRRDEYAVWRSDGTEAGTTLIAPDTIIASHPFGDLLLMRSAEKVWRTDGTSNGTFSIFSGRAGTIASGNGVAHFVSGGRAWRTDGSTAIPIRPITKPPSPNVFEAAMAGDRAFLLQRYWQPWWIYALDENGESQLVTRIEVQGGDVLSIPEVQIVQIGTLAYFVAPMKDGPTLWRTDGTAEGTFALPAFASLAPGSLARFGDRLLFSGSNGIQGFEPWISDGTAEGTMMLINVAAEGRIHGTVTDDVTRTPLEGIKIHVAIPGQQWVQVTTDENGRYAVEGLYGSDIGIHSLADDWYLLASKFICVKPNDDLTVDLQVKRGARVTGRVTDTNGNPLVHARVLLGPHQYLRLAFSNADGTFAFNAVDPKREYTIYVEDHPNGFAKTVHPGTLILSRGEHRAIDFAMKPWGRLRVRVLDALTGMPTPDERRVIFHKTPTPDWTYDVRGNIDADGYAEMALPEGAYYVTAFPDGYQTTTHPGGAFSVPTATRTEIDPIHVPAKGARVSVKTVDAVTGAPVGNVTIYMTNAARHNVLRKETDAAGVVVSTPDLVPGVYRVTAFSTSLYAPSLPMEITVGHEPIVNVEIALQVRALVHGPVVDAASGVPMLSLLPKTDPEQHTFVNYPTEVFMIARPGTTTLTLEALGWHTSRTVWTLASGDRVRHEFRLEPNCLTAVSPRIAQVPAGGGTVRFRVEAPADCTYSIQQNSLGISYTPKQATGSTDVTVLVGSSSWSKIVSRTFVVPGSSFTLIQAAKP